jgi:hypothetical protein
MQEQAQLANAVAPTHWVDHAHPRGSMQGPAQWANAVVSTHWVDLADPAGGYWNQPWTEGFCCVSFTHSSRTTMKTALTTTQNLKIKECKVLYELEGTLGHTYDLRKSSPTDEFMFEGEYRDDAGIVWLCFKAGSERYSGTLNETREEVTFLEPHHTRDFFASGRHCLVRPELAALPREWSVSIAGKDGKVVTFTRSAS